MMAGCSATVPSHRIGYILQERYRKAAARVGRPYLWVTWMTKLISGEACCDWSLWFRARHSFDKLESGFDLKQWTAEHDALLAWRAGRLRETAVWPNLERSMTVEGATATIAGKSDIYYLAEGVACFEDCKTGKRRDSDHVQVLLYVWLHGIRQRVPSRGTVVYKDGLEEVDMSRLDQIQRDALRLVCIAASSTPAERRPSASECRSCNIAEFYCHERQHSPGSEIFQTDMF